MQIGLTGFASLSWPQLLRLRAESVAKPTREKTAVIMVWLGGGLSHLDSYDPKPDIETEYRGPFDVISTKVPGLQFTELLPMQAKIADKFTILRSMSHKAAGHSAGCKQLLSGDMDVVDKPRPRLPDWMSVAAYLRSKEQQRRTSSLPNYVGVNPVVEYNGPAYVGAAYAPFAILGDPNRPDFEVPNVGLSDPSEESRLSDRVALRRNLDKLERRFDRDGELGALDQFEAQAMTLLTNPETREAFDLSEEDDRTRDRYGRNRWGQQLLLARRLVESGVEIVTSLLDGPQCGRIMNWDDHSVNHHIFDALRFRAPPTTRRCRR